MKPNMQEQHSYEYAVIRVVPRVEREEFLNVGVVLYCRKRNFLQVRITVNDALLCAFARHEDVAEIKEHLLAFERIAGGGKDAGPIGRLDAASRFRWLTATRSTVVQSSKVHPGLCSDPEATLTRLHEKLVL